MYPEINVRFYLTNIVILIIADEISILRPLYIMPCPWNGIDSASVLRYEYHNYFSYQYDKCVWLQNSLFNGSETEFI